MAPRLGKPALALVLTVPLAAAAVLPACGPRVDPGTTASTGADAPVAGPPRPAAPGRGGRAGVRDVLIGEMCPKAAAGRPAVLPLFLHTIGWTSDPNETAQPIERLSARQFAALGWDGRRVGVFSVAGPTQLDEGVVASGAYAGGSPCEKRHAAGSTAELDAACVATQAHCALVFSALEPAGGWGARPYEEQPDPADLVTGGACMAGDLLLVDADGDGAMEAYPAAAFVDESRGPADEVLAVAPPQKRCAPRFALRGAVPAADPRDWRGLDVLGVADFDGDGRREIVVVYQYQGRRTWGLYSPTESVARLDLVGEGVPWQVR